MEENKTLDLLMSFNLDENASEKTKKCFEGLIETAKATGDIMKILNSDTLDSIKERLIERRTIELKGALNYIQSTGYKQGGVTAK